MNLPSIPALYQGQSYPTFLHVSSGYTDHSLQGSDFWLQGAWPTHPLSPAEVWNGEVLSQACQKAGALSLTCPGNRALQTGLSDCLPRQENCHQPCDWCRRDLSLCSLPPPSPAFGWVSSPPSGFREERSHMPIRRAASVSKTSSVMSKAEGWNLVHFIIGVIQLF